MSADETESISNPALRLRWRYLACLGLISGIVLTNLALTTKMSGDQVGRSTVIDVAGRQRMLSQKMVKAALADDSAQLARDVAVWRKAHLWLQSDGEDGPGPKLNDVAILAMYRALDDDRQVMSDAIDRILDPVSPADREQALAVLLDHEAIFLEQMNAIVSAYADAGEASVNRLGNIELMLALILLLAVVVEAVIVFEPMVRRLRRHWQKMVESEQRFALAVTGSRDAIWDWDLAVDRVYVASQIDDVLGKPDQPFDETPEALMNRICSHDLPRFDFEIQSLIHGDQQELDTEIRMNHVDGSTRWMLCRGRVLRDDQGRAIRLAGSLADITVLKESADRLRLLAERDQLTGLANRKYFTDQLDLRIDRTHRQQADSFAVLFLDFDRFKTINDSHGHSVGDGLLISIAERLGGQLPPDAMAARFGGDEFAILLTGDKHRINSDCERLLAVLAEAHQVFQHKIVSTASIGVVAFDERYDGAEAMLRDADTAMYEAKDRGKAQLVRFDVKMHEEAVRRMSIESRLLDDEIQDEMFLVYQPIVSLSDGSLTGFEALVRWDQPGQGLVPPDVFIPIAEECGAILAIGRWIFDSVARQLQAWDLQFGHTTTVVNVNISRKQLLQSEFISFLESFAAESPELAARLILEITETAMTDDRVGLVPALEALRGAGYRLAMDDFGTGYSSLSCLHNFPIDILKVDRCFLKNMETHADFAAVFNSIVTLAQTLGLKVVAEGIDCPIQLASLQAMNCGYGQGYLFAKPLKVEEATAMIEDPRLLLSSLRHAQAA